MRLKNKIMKKYILLLAMATVLAGCANRYDITTNSGAMLRGVTKPVLHKETDEYFFKDASGKQMALRSGWVRTIEVHEEKGSQFKNQTDSGFKVSPSSR